MKKISPFLLILSFVSVLTLIESCNFNTSEDKETESWKTSYAKKSTAITTLKDGFESGVISTDYWNLEGYTLPSISALSPKTGTYCAKLDVNMYGAYTKNYSAMYLSNVTIESSGSISFDYKTDLHYSNDETNGIVLQSFTFYVDGVKQASFDGLSGEWTTVSFDLAEGTHTLKWEASCENNNYWEDHANAAYVDNIEITQIDESMYTKISSLSETFDSLDTSIWYTKGITELSTDEVYSSWAQYGNALAADTHGSVLKLSYVKKSGSSYSAGEAIAMLPSIEPEEDSYLVFDYKCSFYCKDTSRPYSSESYVKLYVDGEAQGSGFGYMGNSNWQTSAVKLSAGSKHSVKWYLPKQSYYYKSFQNCMYLDNVRLVSAADYETVDLSPKGQQDTCVGGTLQFTASAPWSSSAPVWSVSGGGSIDSSGLFTASAEGTYTVTASVDGKTASNTTVTVHSANYLSEAVSVSGFTFTGQVTNLSGDLSHEYITSKAVTINSSSPQGAQFSTDGFFVLSGTVNDSANSYYLIISKLEPVQSQNGDFTYQSTYKYYFSLSGTFNTRVWLRFGSGLYGISLAKSNGTTISGPRLYTVTNTSTVTYSQAAYLMPSSIVNSDSFEVSNAVHDALYGLDNATTGVKLQALHDWLQHHFYYDYVSLDSSLRKDQGTVNCLRLGMGVCEGYANTFAAMARYCGIQTKVIGAYTMNHAWNEVYYNGSYQMVDVTWDDTYYDPEQNTSNTYRRPEEENYRYFIVSTTGVNKDHVDSTAEALSRSAITNTSQTDDDSLIPPYNRDLPDGWY